MRPLPSLPLLFFRLLGEIAWSPQMVCSRCFLFFFIFISMQHALDPHFFSSSSVCYPSVAIRRQNTPPDAGGEEGREEEDGWEAFDPDADLQPEVEERPGGMTRQVVLSCLLFNSRFLYAFILLSASVRLRRVLHHGHRHGLRQGFLCGLICGLRHRLRCFDTSMLHCFAAFLFGVRTTRTRRRYF